MSRYHSGSQNTPGAAIGPLGWASISRETAMDRPRQAARIAALVVLVLGLALLSLGCGAPEQRASASQLAGSPAVAVEEVPPVGAAVAPAVVVSQVSSPVSGLMPNEPIGSIDETQEASAVAEPAGLDADPPLARPSLVDRSGQRVPEEIDLSPEAAAVTEKLANVQALNVASPAISALMVRSAGVLTSAGKAPTPKPVVRTPVPVPVPIKPTGSWVELPNVRPIPSAYFSAVHQWDSITNYYAAYYHVDPDLIRRIIYVESKGDQYAYVASSGVMGLMQIKAGWFKVGEDPYNAWTNIRKGTWILRYGFDYYHTWFKAVSWYCYGDLKRFGASIPTYYASLIFSPVDVTR